MILEYTESIWNTFAKQENLTATQLEQFKMYYAQLVTWNDMVNLTRITNEHEAVAYHFQDSLRIGHTVDFSSITTIADIGSGAGFPSIPLKIKYPHLHVVIIEVSGKRIAFLQHIITLLGLTNVTLCQQDWRTFLRHHTEPIDYFFARASLPVSELLRIFKPASHYQQANLVYWASEQWQPETTEHGFIHNIVPYKVGSKSRKLVFFSIPTLP